jgi:uncharacterized protein (DUF302 family)
MLITLRCRRGLGEVRQRFEDAAQARKFGVQAIHNVTATLQGKGLAFERRLYVYEVCSPAAAKKVLDTDVRIATALPCRVSIYVDRDEVVLETLRPTAVLGLFQRPELAATAAEVEAQIEAIMQAAAG